MFAPVSRRFDYKISTLGGTVFPISVVLDAQGLNDKCARPVNLAAEPGIECEDCEVRHGICVAEASLRDVVLAFGELQSTEILRAEVDTDGRRVSIEAPAARVLGSLMGLLMASSGCPRLIPFRAMALFHQPFSTPEETAIRAASFTLMRAWAQSRLHPEYTFDELLVIWESLESVNRHVWRKILAQADSDAAVNGIAFLDALAKLGALGLESALEAINPVLVLEGAHQNN